MGRVQKPDKAAKAVKKTLWQKLKGLTAENNSESAKRRLFFLLSNAVEGGAKVGHHVLVGTNSVLKCIHKQQASIVCVSRDSPKALFNCVIEACALTATPVVALPSTSSVEMASTFSLKKATIFALPIAPGIHKNIHIQQVSKQTCGEVGEREGDAKEGGGADINNMISHADRIDGMIDGVRDVAMEMYTPNFLFKDTSSRCSDS
jgi:ribosomal protein L7Ae-like RNA K-turn-binding protein